AFKSTDGGQSWHAINDGIVDVKYINSFAFDPADHHTLYAGAFEDGVYSSTDGGKHWDQHDFLTGGGVLDVVAAPTVPTTIYTATSTGNGGGVYRSTDGAQTWKQVGL